MRCVVILCVCSLLSVPVWAEPPDVPGPSASPTTAETVADVDVAVDVDAGVAAPVEPISPDQDDLHRPLGTTDMMTSFIKTMLMLGVVLALAWLTLAKGMGKLVEKAQAGKRVKVIERIALDARRSLFLVDVDGVQFVVGGGDLVRLHEVGADKRSFSSILATTSPPPRAPPTTTTTTTNTTGTTHTTNPSPAEPA